MLVAEDVPLQLQFNPFDILPAVVRNMHIDVYACPAHPDLAMKACSDFDNFYDVVSGSRVFVGGSERAW